MLKGMKLTLLFTERICFYFNWVHWLIMNLGRRLTAAALRSAVSWQLHCSATVVNTLCSVHLHVQGWIVHHYYIIHDIIVILYPLHIMTFILHCCSGQHSLLCTKIQMYSVHGGEDCESVHPYRPLIIIIMSITLQAADLCSGQHSLLYKDPDVQGGEDCTTLSHM